VTGAEYDGGKSYFSHGSTANKSDDWAEF